MYDDEFSSIINFDEGILKMASASEDYNAALLTLRSGTITLMLIMCQDLYYFMCILKNIKERVMVFKECSCMRSTTPVSSLSSKKNFWLKMKATPLISSTLASAVVFAIDEVCSDGDG